MVSCFKTGTQKPVLPYSYRYWHKIVQNADVRRILTLIMLIDLCGRACSQSMEQDCLKMILKYHISGGAVNGNIIMTGRQISISSKTLSLTLDD